MAGNKEKAKRYISELVDARCNGQWQAVPELARKVEKHSPRSSLLTLTARAQARVYTQPSIANFKSAELEYGKRIADALGSSNTSQDVDEALDARTCGALILFGSEQYDAALSRLPALVDEPETPTSGVGERAWKAICILQGYLLRGLTLERQGEPNAASNVYRSVIKYISQIVTLPVQSSQLRRWTEELLCRICIFFSTDLETRPAQLGEAMACFHLLSKFLDAGGWRNISSVSILGCYSPRAIWRAYYETLSRTIHDDLVYHPSPQLLVSNASEPQGALDEDDFTKSRIQQRFDLKRVGVNYEALLLKETAFPRSNETNKEVESWIDLVMSNWRVLCGPTWTNEELGAGGKSLLGRMTLDILYRAATKTFHSTQILRHLFTLHSYVGEFDLAMKAFDSYVEIITRGKARQEKSNDAEPDLDDDVTGVRVAAEAIRISCRYGPGSIAEKAAEIGENLEGWLKKGTTESGVKSLRDSTQPDGHATDVAQGAGLPRDIQMLAWGAIGIGEGHCAQVASSPAHRTTLQKKAIEHLRAALDQDSHSVGYVEASYALAMMLAETRDVDGALQIVRRALKDAKAADDLANPDGALSSSSDQVSRDINVEKLTRRRKTLPLWHLLGQLLSAREDFEEAMQCCQVALDQFITIADLLIKDPPEGRRKESLGVSRMVARPTVSDPLADRIDSFEKQTVIEMKMTQLALLEIAEGPEAAVNSSNELFGLFSRMFGQLDVSTIRVPHIPAGPPRASHGTVRSIFGRYKAGTDKAQRFSSFPSRTTTARTSRPTTSTTNAPTIQVTNTNGSVTPARQSADISTRRRNALRKKYSGSIRRTVASHQSSVQTTTFSSARPSMEGSPMAGSALPGQTKAHNEKVEQVPPATNGVHNEPQIAHNKPTSQQPPPVGQYPQSTQHDTRLPVLPPKNINVTTLSPLFSKLESQRLQTTILVQIWLFVARLYAKSAIYTDALSSISEANNLVAALESAIAVDHASVKLFQDQGWGGGKSIEDLWADVHNERARLYLAEGLPHVALLRFDRALFHSPDHAEAIVGLGEILLDIYADVIPSETPDPEVLALAASVPLTTNSTITKEPTPPTLNRIAARDRAYALLSSLTKLGNGWDMPEAWFALARAYELSGQIDKAKEALWWCVHLEDTNPVRHWRHVSPGGLVL